MYADKITGSMERAMAEMERRRKKQLEFNEAHGIKPRTVQKEVREIMEGARAAIHARGGRKVAEPRTDYAGMSPEMMLKKIARLEKQMYQHARDLEFEEAAKVRDEIDAIRKVGLGFTNTKAG
jgi:excinuclease ABC subunit B